MSVTPEMRGSLVKMGNEVAKTIDMSPAQELALSDDLVTVEEYHRSFDDFGDCVSAAGADLMSVDTDPETGEIDYASRAVDALIVDGCYNEHFMFVDAAYQSSPAIQAKRGAEFRHEWATVVHPCLEANGILGSPAQLSETSIDTGTQEASWYEQYFQLLLAGSCGQESSPAEVHSSNG